MPSRVPGKSERSSESAAASDGSDGGGPVGTATAGARHGAYSAASRGA